MLQWCRSRAISALSLAITLAVLTGFGNVAHVASHMAAGDLSPVSIASHDHGEVPTGFGSYAATVLQYANGATEDHTDHDHSPKSAVAHVLAALATPIAFETVDFVVQAVRYHSSSTDLNQQTGLLDLDRPPRINHTA